MLNRLDRLWRSFGIGLFLVLIGVGGSLMAVTIFPLLALVIRAREPRRQVFQWVLHHSFRLYAAGIHWLRIADIRFEGAERLRNLRGTLIIANHPSILDVVLIMAAVPSVQCVVKAGLWRNPFFHLTMRSAGYIRNDLEPEAFMAACVGALKAGQNLIIFPEGTRTVPGQPMQMRRGFANIATLAEADVQLVTMRCEPPILFKGDRWWNAPRKRSEFSMTVGEVLDIDEFLRDRPRPLSARKLVAFVEDYYSEKLRNGRAATGNQDIDRVLAES